MCQSFRRQNQRQKTVPAVCKFLGEECRRLEFGQSPQNVRDPHNRASGTRTLSDSRFSGISDTIDAPIVPMNFVETGTREREGYSEQIESPRCVLDC